MIRFMLDTNVCVDLLRGKHRRMVQRLRQYEPDEVGISAITMAELQHGVFKSRDPEKNQAAVVDFCAALEIMPFDGRAAEAYGRLRTVLQAAGTPIGPFDTLIAAHGISVGCTLVTNNEREFKLVPALTIENWTKADS